MENSQTTKSRPGPKADPELLKQANILREHLEMPADLAHPQRGNRYEAYRAKLGKLDVFAKNRRLQQWWLNKTRIQLRDNEIEACWKWLLPQ